MTEQTELAFGVIGVQLGYFDGDDLLAAARAALSAGPGTSVGDLLVRAGVLDARRQRVLEKLSEKAVAAGSPEASETLEHLPERAEQLLALSTSNPSLAPTAAGASGVCFEQPGRYSAPELAPANLTTLRHDSIFGRDVEWETAPLGDLAAEAQLLAKARLVGRLDHPSVQPVFEVGRTAEGQLYVASQVIGATSTFEAKLATSHGLAERLGLLSHFTTVARCIGSAHEAGSTHRRVSSSVIVLGSFGEVYVTGWSAPAVPANAQTFHEQVVADLAALGRLLDQILSVDGAPADLLAVAKRAQTSGEGAFESARALANEVQAWLDGGQVSSHRYSFVQLLGRLAARNRVFTTALLVACGVLVGFGLVTRASLTDERDRSTRFTQRFLIDLGEQVQPLPGVEGVIERVFEVTAENEQRTHELARAPFDERVALAQALSRLASVLVELGRTQAAVRALPFVEEQVRRVASEQPANAQVLALEARVRLLRVRTGAVAVPELSREVGLAAALADRSLVAAPKSFEAAQLAVQARLTVPSEATNRREAVEQAVALAKEFAARKPDDAAAWSLSCEALVALAQVEFDAAQAEARQVALAAAVDAARHAVSLAPSEVGARVALIERLEALGSFDPEGMAPAALVEASTLAKALVRERPEAFRARQALALVEARLAHFDLAWRQLHQLELEGQLGRLKAARAQLALLAGHFDEALRFTGNTRAADPSDDTGVLCESLAAAMKGQVRQALDLVRRLGPNPRVYPLWPTGSLTQLFERAFSPAALVAAQLVRDLDEGRPDAVEAYRWALEALPTEP